MSELWKPVDGYEGLYEVSSLGAVRSCAKTIATRRGDRTLCQRILSPAKHNGYFRVQLTDDRGKHKHVFLHRLVAEAFISAAEGKFINHKDGVKTNNRVENLEWVTAAENNRHAFTTGLNDVFSLARKNAKLSVDDISDLRVLRSFGVSFSELGRQFGVTHRAVMYAIYGQTWRSAC